MTDQEAIQKETTLSIFVPANQAAICADSMCGGVFLAVNGHCPGCGSHHYVPLQPSQLAADLNRKEP